MLKITDGINSILLDGDMEKDVENFLLKTQGDNLRANIIVAPHHGSATSSTQDFVNMVKPQYVLFPVGYLNRFHFPAAAVVERYAAIGAHLFQVQATGAITFKFDAKSVIPMPELFRAER